MPKDNILDFESCALCHEPYPFNGVRQIHDFGEVVFSTCPKCSSVIKPYNTVVCDIVPVDAVCSQCLADCRFGVVFIGIGDDITTKKVKCIHSKPIVLDTFGNCPRYKEAMTDDMD